MAGTTKAEQTFINWVMGTSRFTVGAATPEDVARGIAAENFAKSLGLNLSQSERVALVSRGDKLRVETQSPEFRDSVRLCTQSIGFDIFSGMSASIKKAKDEALKGQFSSERLFFTSLDDAFSRSGKVPVGTFKSGENVRELLSDIRIEAERGSFSGSERKKLANKLAKIDRIVRDELSETIISCLEAGL
jgi:hypothetical protein